MKTQEILSIIALSLLGLCVLSGLVKMAMKKESHKKPYEQGCAASVFIAVVLLGISQLLTEREKYTGGESNCIPCTVDSTYECPLPGTGITALCHSKDDSGKIGSAGCCY